MMGFWQGLWVSRQRFSQVVARVRLLMLPVLEGPGVEPISATASARDPVIIRLVSPGLHTHFVIDYMNIACKKWRHLTHFRALEPRKPRSSRVQNKRI